MDEVVRLVDTAGLMREWVEYGDASDNPYMRFMAYWVAFNMLYESYKNDTDGEVKAIRNCFDANKMQFSQYDPFRGEETEIFQSEAARALYGSDEKFEIGRKAIMRRRPQQLLYAVYRVRCNFFHGNKKLGDPTDRKFVTSGATIIRGYLSTLGLFPSRG